jgi:phage head maturation protease
MKFKDCRAFKASPTTDQDGRFEAIVSVFGNVDYMGDVVMPGAFAETLAEWKASGDPIPVLWSHRMDDPRFSIGSVVDIAELGPNDARIPEWVDPWVKEHGGLWVVGQLDTGAMATDVAVATRKLLAERRVKQFSFAYDIEDSGFGTLNGQDVYELRKVDIYEVSACQIGCNDLTQLLGAKAVALAAALRDPEKLHHFMTEMSEVELREAMRQMAAVIVDRHSADPTDAKSAKDEEPVVVKSEEPSVLDAESVRLLSDLRRFGLEVI